MVHLYHITLRLCRSATNAWYPVRSKTCTYAIPSKPYLVIAAIFLIITWHSNIWEELLSWMGLMNAIFQWDTVIAVLLFLLTFYSSTFGLVMHQSVWIPWGWTVIPGDSDKGLTDHIGYWHQYFKAFSK